MSSEQIDFDLKDSGPDVEISLVDMKPAEIAFLLKKSPKFFIEFFLGDQLTFEVPQLHVEIWERLIDPSRERNLLAIPRDHAKTTLVKLAIVWHYLFSDHRFVVYLSNTNTIALNACKDVMGFLTCDNFVSVFGRIRVTKSSETESIWQFEMPIMGSNKVKNCTLRAIGANQQIRGMNIDNQRPDLAAIDDVESDENTASEPLQKKLDKWMFGPFMKALARNRKKVFWLGNMLAKTSLLARLSMNPRWNPVVFGAIVIDPETKQLRPLWEDRWSMEELREDFKEYVNLGLMETWMCEMMNMPGHGVNGFRTDQIYLQPQPDPSDVEAAFLVIDPAFGLEADNDDTSITVHVIRSDGLPMIAEDISGKMSEAEMYHNMIYLTRKWGAYVWGIEAIAAQRVLIPFFNLMLANEMMNREIEMIPLISGRGDPKVSRIRSFVSLMAEKQYAIYDDGLGIVNEIFGFDMRKKNNKDDRIDSCAYGPIMLENYLGLIMAHASGTHSETPATGKYGTEVLSV